MPWHRPARPLATHQTVGAFYRGWRLGVGTDDSLYVLFDQVEKAMIRLANELHDRTHVQGDRRPREPGGEGGQNG